MLKKEFSDDRRGISVKWQIISFFVLFCVVMLAVLWLFQVVFLEDFYKGIKTQSVKIAGESIASDVYNYDHDLSGLAEYIDEQSLEHDICIMIVTSEGILHSAERSRYCMVHNADISDIMLLINRAAGEGGSALYRFNYDSKSGMMLGENIQSLVGEGGQPDDGENKFDESILYITVKDGVAILINSAVTPVDSTVQTLRMQLIIIMGVMFVFAMLLAYLISRIISRPVIKLSKSAQELAKGNYDINFSNKGFREIRELGDCLNYAATELGKSEQFQRDILANVSHDLRTPLTMITGYAEVMRDLPGENTPENVQVIIDEASRLTTLVNDALDLSKLQSGYQTAQMEKYHFTKSVEEILERFNKLKAEDGYDIIFEHDKEVWVCGDEVKISQAIYNLIINAITHAGADKKVIVRQKVINRSKMGEDFFVRLEVIDHGEGIDKDKLKDIWHRYYKVDKTHKRAQMGTGLGLSIVRGVLEMHNARYGVESKVHVGSKFWFEIDLSSDWNKPTRRSIESCNRN